MDFVRSCYETDMQFDQAGLIVRRVRWYFAAPNAPFLTGPSVFRSNNYGDIAGGPLGPGEVSTADRPWSDGALPGQPGTPCGDRQWFVDGCPSDAPPLTFNGPLPACCNPDTSGHIGIKLGLQSRGPCPQGLDWTGAVLRMIDAVDGHVMVPARPADSSFPSGAVWVIPPPTTFFRWTVQGANQGNGGMCPLMFNSRPVVFGDYTVAFPLIGSYAPYPGSLVFKGDDQNFWIHPFYQIVTFGPQRISGSLGMMFGLSGTNQIGIKLGLEHVRRAIARGKLGLKVGLESAQRAVVAGELGLQLGLESRVSSLRAGQLGIKLGIVSRLVARVAGTIGIKLGLRSGIRGMLGMKLGLVSALRARLSGALGLKLGLVSTTTAGHVTPCCPGRVIPNTLTAVGSGGSSTATYSSGAGGWSFNDPGSGLSWILTCVNLGGGTFQWRTLGNVGAHCSASYSVTSLTCSPFSVSTHVGITGGSCVTAGSYNFTIHA